MGKGTKDEYIRAVSLVLLRHLREFLHEGNGIHQDARDRSAKDVRADGEVIRDGVLDHL